MKFNINKKKDDNSLRNLLLELWQNLRLKRKKQIYLLLIFSIISGLTEIFSLAAVIPFLSIITNPELIYKVNFIRFISRILNFSTPQELLLPITLIFILSIIFASIIRQFNLWFAQIIAAKIGSDISCGTYKNALNQEYQKHLMQNSSKIINTTINEVDTLVSFINSALLAISSAVLTIILFIGFLLINWKIAILSIIIFGSIYVILSKYIKLRLSKNSLIIANGTKMQQKSIQEGLGGIRNIILDNLQNLYTSIYFSVDTPLRKARAEANYLRMFPRYLLESIGLIIITIIAYLISHNNIEPSLEITILGTFALGAQRLLPAFQQIYSSWAGMGAQIYSARNVLDLLEQNAETEEDNFKNFAFNKSFEIKCEAVSFQYKKTVKETLSNINFSIKPGERIGIIGKTGGGKSTLLDLIMGLLKPSSGRLLVNNIDVNLKYNNNFLKSYQSQISHVPQNIYLSDSSIIENIAFGVPNTEIIMTKVKKAAREAMADEFIENLPEGYNTKVGERGIRLSGGQRQRIAIARALYKDSRIIFFDEATSALDEKTERDLINSIYSLKKDITLVIISHRLSTLSYCEKIVEIKNKKIYLKTNN